MKPKVKLFLASAALLAVCFSVGAGGISLFSVKTDRFLPGTEINGNSCGFMNVQDVLDMDLGIHVTLISDRVDHEVIDITDAYGGSPFEESDLTPILKIQENSIVKSVFFHKAYSVPASKEPDMEKLKDILSSAKCLHTQKATPSQDAYVKQNAGSYEIVPEIYGDEVDLEKLAAEVAEKVKSGNYDINTTKESLRKLPEVTVDSEYIQNFKNLMEHMDNLEITYDFGSRKEVLDSETIKSWRTINDDGSISFDEEKVKAWVKNLAYKYDTYQKPHSFKKSDGETITVDSKTYGWRTDVNKTTETLMNTLLNGENATIAPNYVKEVNYYLPLSREEDDIGGTYVEVSIEDQTAWLYKDGELIMQTPVVTGTKGVNDTPRGLYCVWSRENGAIISNVHVDFWMPVDGVFGSGFGLHDAGWRSGFGGDIYKTNGSHGCINMPRSAAKTIYDNIVAGTPVIVY